MKPSNLLAGVGGPETGDQKPPQATGAANLPASRSPVSKLQSPNFQSPNFQPPDLPISNSLDLRSPISSPHLPSLICWLLIITFAVYFGWLSVQQHNAFQTHDFDVGNVDQALWNTAQGRFMHFTLMPPLQSRLALHVEPILLLFVPLYWLDLGGPKILLMTQAAVVALGAWPLYQIAHYRFCGAAASLRFLPPTRRDNQAGNTSPPRPWAPASLLVFPLAYLLLPTLQSAVLFEFHAVTLAPAFLLFAFWALEQQKDTHLLIFLLLAMACKEDMPLATAMVGLYIGLSRRRWGLAGLIIGSSLIWFGIAFFVIQPHFAAGGNVQLDRYAWLGDRPVTMLQTLIFEPSRVVDHLIYTSHLFDYLAHLLFPTAFLALFSPLTWLPMLPTLAVNLLSNNGLTWRLEDFHYGAPLAPFLIISTIYGLKRLVDWIAGKNPRPAPGPGVARQSDEAVDSESRPERRSLRFRRGRVIRSPLGLPATNYQFPLATYLLYALSLLLLTFTLIYHYHRGYTPLAKTFSRPEVTGHHHRLRTLLRGLPADSVLFTQSNLAPHLTHRPLLYTDFGYFTDPNFPAAQPVDDILLDVTALKNEGGLHQFLRQRLLESGAYRLVGAEDGILHLRPQSDAAAPASVGLPPSFYTFARPAGPPAYNLTADFGDLLRLHGYSLHFDRQEKIRLTLDLEPLRPLPAGIQPVIYLLDAAGKPTGATTDLQPGLVWFPPDQWPVGQRVRVHFNTLLWHTRTVDEYGLALGVVAGDDVWALDRRQPPTLAEPTEFAVRFPAAGSLIELARIEQNWAMPQGGPRLRRFTTPGLPYKLSANFDNQIRLLGYAPPQLAGPQPSPQPTIPSSTLTLTLYWQAVAAPPPLIRFVQVVGPDGLVYGQKDSPPDNGLYPTHLWRPGQVVVETVAFSVQDGRPPGDYTIHMGLYQPDTGRRLPLLSGGDHVEIETQSK